MRLMIFVFAGLRQIDTSFPDLPGFDGDQSFSTFDKVN